MPPLCNMDFKALDSWNGQMARAVGDAPESAHYLKAVCSWRDLFWPSQVRFLAIAESHQAERPVDSGVRVRFPPYASSLIKAELGNKAPETYVRLLHCLAYGESLLCDPEMSSRDNSGTPQFWDVLGMIVHGVDARQPGKQMSTLYERLTWNLATLGALKAKGFHLTDACVLGVARGKKRRFAKDRYTGVIRESFEKFVWPELANEPIEEVWVLGRDVAKALRGMKLSVGLARETGMFTDSNGCLQIDEQRIFSQPRFYQYPMDFVQSARKAVLGVQS